MNYILKTYNKKDIEFKDGEGAYLIDINNKKYLDFGSGIAVNCLGYKNQKLVSKIQEASLRPWHVSNMFKSFEAEKISEKLINSSFADFVFYCNSGAEAVESMIKTIRKYHSGEKTGKNEIITFKNSFHGRTMATISASNKQANVDGFQPLLPGFVQAEFNNIDSVKSLINEKTAGIIIEPVQGEGGINIANQEFLQQLREICNENNIILGFDEVQCGVGRTGKFWAYEKFNVKPDVLSAAKGLGGGFPIGAMLVTKEFGKHMVPGTHGSTFGGNPLALSIMETVIEEVNKEEFLENINSVSSYFKKKTEELSNQKDSIKSIKIFGLMIGIQFNDDVEISNIINKFLNDGLICIASSNNTLRFLPPLIINNNDIDHAFEILNKNI